MTFVPGITLAGITFAFVMTPVIWAVVISERKRRAQVLAHAAQLHAYAAELGWNPIAGPVPGPVAEAMRWRRSQLALGTRHLSFDIWVVWHNWTTNTSIWNLTRYYLWLGAAYPEVRPVRRRGIGLETGIAEFDKEFVIQPTGRPKAVQAVPPEIRQAMLAGHIGRWQITGGMLVLAHEDMPSAENLQPRADALVHLGRMLSDEFGAQD